MKPIKHLRIKILDTYINLKALHLKKYSEYRKENSD